MPPESFMAGSGNASMNMVNTGATNDNGQAPTCETNMQMPVANAMRSIRTLAISIGLALVRVTQDTGGSNVDPGDGIQYPAVTGIDCYRRLRTNTNSRHLARAQIVNVDHNRKALGVP